MLSSRSILACGLTLCLCVCLSSLTSVAHAQAGDFTGFLYVSDYGAQNLDRYSYVYHEATNSIDTIQAAGSGTNGSTNATFISGGISGGFQGTTNDIIAVTNGGASLTRYGLNGAVVGNINVTNADGSAHTFNGLGSIVVTHDGQYLYAPEEGGNVIDKINLATGRIVATTSFTGAHDLAIATDGTIYATAYNKSDSTSQGVYAISDDLSVKKLLITSGTNGLTSPTGITVAHDGSLYIQQNVHNNTNNTAAGPDGVYHFAIDGFGTDATATFDPNASVTSSSSLHSTFGNSLGPDGNIYIAALGGGDGRGGNSGYADGVYKYDPTSKIISQLIAGQIEGVTTSGPSGLIAPKYLQFGVNFIPTTDPGLTPEPSGLLAGLSFLGIIGGGALRLRHRRRRIRK